MRLSIIEHRPWVPEGYRERRLRLLIVGHSHHYDPKKEADTVDLTVNCVQAAKLGEMQQFPFFARQPRYLGLDVGQNAEYYDQVALINFVPQALTHRDASPTSEQVAQGRKRLKRVMADLKATHVFVLSSRLKFGTDLPATDQEENGVPLHVANADGTNFHWATYTHEGQTTKCSRLPHPQAAITKSMQAAFAYMCKI